MPLTGELAPMVFIPKFTTFVGNIDKDIFIGPFQLQAAREYVGGLAVVRRGPIIGADPDLKVAVVEWRGGETPTMLDELDLSSDESGELDFDLQSMTFSLRISLDSDDDVTAVTLWSTGFLRKPVC